ncbi:MAG: hypothetical protein ABI398_11055 [Devosia sp.]
MVGFRGVGGVLSIRLSKPSIFASSIFSSFGPSTMNNPPTKKRNYRYTKPTGKEGEDMVDLPDGHFETGMSDPGMLEVYGRAIMTWPVVEDAMSHVLGELIGTNDHEIASEIFHALLAQNTRLPVMLALLQNTRTNATKAEDFDQMLSEFKRLNDERNRLIHSYWFTHRGTDTVYCCPSGSALPHAMRKGRVVTQETLVAFLNAESALMRRALRVHMPQEPQPEPGE